MSAENETMPRLPSLATCLTLASILAACGSEGAAANAPPGAEPAVEPSPDGGGPQSDGGVTPPVVAHLEVQVGSTSVAVRRGGSAKLPVTVARTGVTGPLQLEVLGLPAGLTAPPVTIASGENSAALAFAATPAAALGKTALTLRATGQGLTIDTPIDATVFDGEQLDPTFGTKGIAVFSSTTRPFSGRSLAVLSDSKAVVGMSFDDYAGTPNPTVAGFVRFDASGVIDSAFGTAGQLIPTAASLGGYEQTLMSSVIANSAGGFVGIITAQFKENAGKTKGDVLLLAYQTNGTPDPAFGTAGVVKIDLGDEDSDPRLTRDTSGRWVAVTSVETPTGRDAVISRYLATGQLDATFGSAGRLRTTFGGEKPFGFEVRAFGDALVVTGSRFQAGTNSIHGFVARITPAGALDPTYGDAGSGVHDQTYQVLHLDVGTDGRAYLENSGTLYRLLPNGQPDPAYAPDGKMPQDGSFLYGVPLAAASGRVYRFRGATGQPRVELRAYGNNGVLDTAFGTAGKIVVQPSDANAYPEPQAIGYTPDGRAVGLASRFGAHGFITLARFLL